MAQNITLLGASYSDVPAVELPITGGGTARFDDASVTTATASDVASGKVFLASDGTVTTGTSSGGSSSWTKVAETSYQVSTSSTSAGTAAMWETGHSEIWTSAKLVYVRVRDTAGKRAGYFYGSDNFFYNVAPANSGSVTGTNTSLHMTIRYSTSGQYEISPTTSTTGYGVYSDTLYKDGRVRIRSRYNNIHSLTIDGTYKVEVYLLDPAGGVPIFE